MNDPRVSVIVPVYNDPEGVRQTLDSLLDQTFEPAGYEILVIDNGSTDATLDVVRRVIDANPGRVALHVETAVRTSYGARNRGIREARGSVLAFLDADVTVDPGYLAGVWHHLGEQDLEYLGCKVQVTMPSPTLAAKYDAIHAFPTAKYFELYRFVPTCCLSVRRDLLDRTGPFDARLESGGDLDFAGRAERAEARKGFANELVVRHPARISYGALLKKRARLGRGAAQRDSAAAKHVRGRRLSLTEHVLPSNPVRIHRAAVERGVPLTMVETLVLSTFKLPLAWANFAAYVQESRRLRRPAGDPDRDDRSARV